MSLDMEIKGGIARLTLARPEVHNAFDEGLIAALHDALATVDRDDVRVVVLAAQGRSFSAGADLNWMRRAADFSVEENRADALRLAAMLERLNSLGKPTVALVQGAAFGGGVGLVACCDIAIAAQRASFALSEVRLGLVPGVISPYVVAAIGARQARRLFVSGVRIEAAEAAGIGLVHRVVTEEQLEAAGQETIEALLQCGPQAQAAAKRLVFLVAGRPIDEALRQQTAQAIADARASDEGKEGLAAFLEKRAPAWRPEEDA